MSEPTTEDVMAGWEPPEETTTAKRRSRRAKAATETENTESEPKHTQTRTRKKISDPKAIRRDANALIAKAMVWAGADPSKVYADPPQPDMELIDPNYTADAQPYLLSPTAAERLALLTDKVNNATAGKIEKVKNSKVGIGWSLIMAVVEMSTTLQKLAKLMVEIKSQSQAQQGNQSGTETTNQG